MSAALFRRGIAARGRWLVCLWLSASACSAPAPAVQAGGASDAAATGDTALDAAGESPADAAADTSGDAPQDTASADAADPGQAAAAWCAAWASATCELWAKCPLAALGQPQDGCAARLTQQCQGGAALGKALQAKQLVFDAAQAKICLESLQNLQCPALYQGLVAPGPGAAPACTQVWTGQVAAGGPCVLGGECQAGARCVFGASCPGTCAAWSPLGGACSASQPCDPDTAYCNAGTCAALPAEPGASCPAGLCASPLYCGSAGKCAAFALEGAACSPGGAQCWPGLGCWAAQGQAGTCKPRGGVGSACLSQANCAPQADGAPLVCLAGSCQPAPGPGKPCFDWQCQGGWCDSQALPPTCVAWPSAGQPCPQGWCGSGAVCSAGQCKALGAAGKACAAAEDCLSGHCLGGSCSAPGVSPCL